MNIGVMTTISRDPTPAPYCEILDYMTPERPTVSHVVLIVPVCVCLLFSCFLPPSVHARRKVIKRGTDGSLAASASPRPAILQNYTSQGSYFVYYVSNKQYTPIADLSPPSPALRPRKKRVVARLGS